MKALGFCFLVLFLASGCYSPELLDLDILTIKEGRHRAQPYDLTWNDESQRAYEWTTNDTWVYDLGNRNQCDWNKLTGYSFEPFTNHQDAIMVAWRYDLQGHLLFAPYYHEDGNTWWASAACSVYQIAGLDADRDLPVLRADVDDIIQTHLIVNRDSRYTAVFILNTSTGEQVFWEKYWDRRLGNVREIYPWFGGNEPAPHDIFLYRRLLDRQ
jgi:hypothetical protein